MKLVINRKQVFTLRKNKIPILYEYATKHKTTMTSIWVCKNSHCASQYVESEFCSHLTNAREVHYELTTFHMDRNRLCMAYRPDTDILK